MEANPPRQASSKASSLGRSLGWRTRAQCSERRYHSPMPKQWRRLLQERLPPRPQALEEASVNGFGPNGLWVIIPNLCRTNVGESSKGGIFQGLKPWKKPLLEDSAPMVYASLSLTYAEPSEANSPTEASSKAESLGRSLCWTIRPRWLGFLQTDDRAPDNTELIRH